MRSILYLNTKNITQMTQVSNKEFCVMVNNQLSHERKFISCENDIVNINWNIYVNSLLSIYKKWSLLLMSDFKNLIPDKI